MRSDQAGAGAPSSGRRTAAAIAGIIALFVLGSVVSRYLYPDRPPVVQELSGSTMGTTWTAKLVVPSGAVALVEAARDSIVARLDRVNASMSTWDPESEISRFNRSGSVEPFPVSVEFVDVVRRAEAVSQATNGAFDVTVAPLVTLWGFGADGTAGEPADPVALPAVMAHVGYAKLRIGDDGRSLSKVDPEVSIDLSAIAKGYGVDRAAEALSSMGLTAYAVEVGGKSGPADGSPTANRGSSASKHRILPREPCCAAYHCWTHRSPHQETTGISTSRVEPDMRIS